MELKTSKNPLIIQHNRMLLGSQRINLRSRQLVYAMARAASPIEDSSALIGVDATEFLNFVNESEEKWSDIYALTKSISKDLNENPIYLKNDDTSKDYIEVNWFASLGVVKGKVVARFTPEIAYYLAYKQNESYTKLFWDLRSYRSKHVVRLLDLFQSYHRKESGELEITFKYEVEELKFFLGVDAQYSKFSDMKRRVLEPCRKELEENDYVPYWFEYDVIRKGKTAWKIAFTIHVRHEVLRTLIPNLRLLKSKPNSPNTLFDAALEKDLTEAQKALIGALKNEGIAQNFATNIVSNLSDPQGIGYLDLVRYGVNRSLAFTIIKQNCSFGELVGYEDHYIRHCLEITEKQRLERIEAAKTGKSRKKTTPKDKRGGLAKKVFAERLHFSSFMERLSAIRRKEFEEEL